mmetsp:Transcript_20106/g.50016  ORF Transcript_20106/g.50016 Transcript_20106/m.50016 type:complete len:223 (-) Transcript_20106:165-833(-)
MHLYKSRIPMILWIPNNLWLPGPVDLALFLDPRKIDAHRVTSVRGGEVAIVILFGVRQQILIRQSHLNGPGCRPILVVEASPYYFGGRFLAVYLEVLFVAGFGYPPRVFFSAVVIGLIEHEIPHRVDRIYFEFLVMMVASKGIDKDFKVRVFLKNRRIVFVKMRLRFKVRFENRPNVHMCIVPDGLEPGFACQSWPRIAGGILLSADVVKEIRKRDIFPYFL